MELKLPSEAEARTLINSARLLFTSEETIPHLEGNISVIADLDGTFSDLERIIQEERKNGTEIFVFLGDLLSRGDQCLAVLLHILRMKVSNPQSIYIIRDARFAVVASERCNMKLNCIEYYSDRLFDELLKCLEALPLAAVLRNTIYTTRGGIPCYRNDHKVYLSLNDEVDSVAYLSDLKRGRQSRRQSLRCFSAQKEEECRVLSYSFSNSVASEFLVANRLKMIVGCHEFWEDYSKNLNDGSQITVVKNIYTDPVVDGASVAPTRVYRVYDELQKEVVYDMPDKVKDYSLPQGKSLFDVVAPLVSFGIVDLQGHFNMLQQKMVVEQVRNELEKARFGTTSEVGLRSISMSREIFHFLEKSSNEVLTVDSVLNMWVKNENEPVVRLLLGSFSSGCKLREEEFIQMVDSVMSDDKKVRMRLFFNFFDYDKDGRITRDDILQVLEILDDASLLKMSLKSMLKIACQTVKTYGSHFATSDCFLELNDFKKATRKIF